MVLSAGASVPVDSGCTALPTHGCVHQPRSAPILVLVGFLWRLPHVDRSDSELNLQLPFPSLEGMVGWGGTFQASHHALVFLVTSPHPGVHQELPHQQERHFYCSGLGAQSQELGSKAKYQNKMPFVLLSPRKLQGLQALLCQEMGAKTNTCIFYYFICPT